MHGTLKFIGSVAGKKGVFAGVQLAPEYAARGKNSGDVEGRYYFRTTIPGSGIFLPIEKAIKMDGDPIPATAGKTMGPPPTTPKTPGALGAFNQGGRTPAAASNTLGTLPKPSFTQSLGPGARPASPAAKGRRESIPRPTSPLRKVQNSSSNMASPGAGAAGKLNTPRTRPSLGFARSVTTGGPPTTGSRYGASPAGRVSTARGTKFSQSLRQSVVTPNKTTKTEASPLGPEAIFDEEPEEAQTATPTPAPVHAKGVDGNEAHDQEIRKLKESLDDRDRHLKDQAASIAEMERSLAELQRLIPDAQNQDALQTVRRASREATARDDLPADVQSLRQALREKNEKIKALTAEFDANRADFRSTIDTLEMASTETERVYEKRVDELLEEVRGLQDRSEDVEGVARQFKQLEELVQELEEGLEDARRGESEARAENEFLRGEVERLRSAMKKLKDAQIENDRRDAERTLSGEDDNNGLQVIRQQLEQKDDEVRSLKTIITEMKQKNAFVDPSSMQNGIANGHRRDHSSSQDLEAQIRDLRDLLLQKSDRAEELENELSRLRSNSHKRLFSVGNNQSNHQASNGGHLVSDRAVVPKSQLRGQSHTTGLGMVDEDTMNGKQQDENTRSQSRLTDASSTALWCEICEEGGHDVLTCRNMNFDPTTHAQTVDEEPRRSENLKDRSAPLRTWSNTDISSNGVTTNSDASSFTTSRPSTSFPGPGPHMPPPATPAARPLKFPNQAQGHHQKSASQATIIASPTSNHTPPTMTTTFAAGISHITNNLFGTTKTSYSPTAAAQQPPPPTSPSLDGVIGGAEAAEKYPGMVAGKSSGVIDPDRWCALCERDGHESVDCPDEEASF